VSGKRSDVEPGAGGRGGQHRCEGSWCGQVAGDHLVPRAVVVEFVRKGRGRTEEEPDLNAVAGRELHKLTGEHGLRALEMGGTVFTTGGVSAGCTFSNFTTSGFGQRLLS